MSKLCPGKMGNYYVAWQVSKICRTQLMVHNVALNSTQLNQSVSQSVHQGLCPCPSSCSIFTPFVWQGNLSNSTNARKSLRCLPSLLPSSDFIPSQSKPSSSLTLFTSDMVYHTTPHSLPLCRGRELLPLPPRVAFVCGLPVGISAPC